MLTDIECSERLLRVAAEEHNSGRPLEHIAFSFLQASLAMLVTIHGRDAAADSLEEIAAMVRAGRLGPRKPDA
jgi:hypothetical protein